MWECPVPGLGWALQVFESGCGKWSVALGVGACGSLITRTAHAPVRVHTPFHPGSLEVDPHYEVSPYLAVPQSQCSI